MSQIIHVHFGPDSEGVEGAVSHHPAGKGVSAQQRSLLEVQKWSNRIDIAREGYAAALDACRELGLSNSAIARSVGKSEAAIRMHFERRKR